MATTKTLPGKASVKDFISGLDNSTRRQDAEALVSLFENATGWRATMWGKSIVGFGSYHYTYDSGRSGDICVVGFSPQKAHIAVYMHPDTSGKTAALLAKLGKHKGGLESCLYVNKLADIDVTVFEKMIKMSVAALKKTAAEKGWPVTAG
jgi:hypothetical protein